MQWAKKVTFTGDSYIAGSAWHEQALHLHGYFYSTTLFGSVLLEPQGSVDAFYGQIDPGDGSVALAERFTGTGSDLGLGINAENDALTLSGNSSSTVLHIDSFSVVGNFNSIYVVGTALVAPLNITEIAVSNASCPDLADGSATITVSGGTAPFTYTWSDGQTTASATSLLPGVYMVTATDHVGVQITDSVNIGAPMPLVAGFSNVVSNLTATFSNTSENASAYIWTFGDGESSAATDPMHTYLNAGTYAITLIAMNNCGADTFSQILVLSPNGAAPTANFMADKVELCIGMDDTLHFINQSVNGLTYLWSFPGGMPSMSMDENPAVVYSMPGIYTVILTASNAFGQDVATKTAYISVIALPIAAFEVVISGLQVTLTNNAQFGSDFQWEFGDNTTSTLVAPVHTYQAAGNYIIRLAVQNVCGASIVEKIVSVGMVATATPEWQEGLRIYPNPNKGTFTIEFNSQLNQDLELSLFSPEGKLLRQEMRGVHVGKESQVFANEGLPEGIYLLRVRENAQSKFLRVVVHH